MARTGRLRPWLYDAINGRFDKKFGAPARRKLLRSARGRVLEVGVGTGLNLPHYPAEIEELVVTDPSGECSGARGAGPLGSPASSPFERTRPNRCRIQTAGFEVVELEHGELPMSPPIVRQYVVGRAVVPDANGGADLQPPPEGGT